MSSFAIGTPSSPQRDEQTSGGCPQVPNVNQKWGVRGKIIAGIAHLLVVERPLPIPINCWLASPPPEGGHVTPGAG